MAYTDRIAPIPLQSYDLNGITAAYQPVITLPEACVNIKIRNSSFFYLKLSLDGATDHLYMVPSSEKQWNFQYNNSPENYVAMLSRYTVVYAKEDGGVKPGTLYISGWYLV